MVRGDALRLHVLVRGKVQGVWFRESTRQEAERLAVAGWVRNLPNGDVEAVMTGPAPQVHALVDWCRRGPPNAQVQEVHVQVQDGPMEVGFRVLRA